MKLVSKKIQVIVLALIMLGTVAACDWGKSTTIVSKTENLSQRIKYSGKIVFNANEDGIEHISNGGYLEFEQNDKGFKARESYKGRVEYEFDGDDKVTELSDQQKQFVASAVKTIIKERAKLRHTKN
jgi:maltose-binding protein MalE